MKNRFVVTYYLFAISDRWWSRILCSYYRITWLEFEPETQCMHTLYAFYKIPRFYNLEHWAEEKIHSMYASTTNNLLISVIKSSWSRGKKISDAVKSAEHNPYADRIKKQRSQNLRNNISEVKK